MACEKHQQGPGKSQFFYVLCSSSDCIEPCVYENKIVLLSCIGEAIFKYIFTITRSEVKRSSTYYALYAIVPEFVILGILKGNKQSFLQIYRVYHLIVDGIPYHPQFLAAVNFSCLRMWPIRKPKLKHQLWKHSSKSLSLLLLNFYNSKRTKMLLSLKQPSGLLTAR